MHLEKYHGLRNDFLILIDLDACRPIDEAITRSVCDRHAGVGADGLIRVTAGSAGADVTMELRNADGSRAEMSGNGIRCVARAVIDAGVVAGPVVIVATDAGHRRVTLGAGGMFSVDMGPATLVGGHDDPSETRRHLAVDMGNPHVVIEVDDPAKLDLRDERTFPGANVEFVAVAAGGEASALTMRVRERGVGETQSCGTGACAAAAAAREWGLIGDRVTVHQPGGDSVVDLKPHTVVLTGPASHICGVEVPWL